MDMSLWPYAEPTNQEFVKLVERSIVMRPVMPAQHILKLLNRVVSIPGNTVDITCDAIHGLDLAELDWEGILYIHGRDLERAIHQRIADKRYSQQNMSPGKRRQTFAKPVPSIPIEEKEPPDYLKLAKKQLASPKHRLDGIETCIRLPGRKAIPLLLDMLETETNLSVIEKAVLRIISLNPTEEQKVAMAKFKKRVSI